MNPNQTKGKGNGRKNFAACCSLAGFQETDCVYVFFDLIDTISADCNCEYNHGVGAACYRMKRAISLFSQFYTSQLVLSITKELTFLFNFKFYRLSFLGMLTSLTSRR